MAFTAEQKQAKKRYHATRYLKWAAIIDKLKACPCKDCGGVFPAVCMDFDHVTGEKKFNMALARQGNYSEEKILEEVAKCEVICANCHRIRTRDRRG